MRLVVFLAGFILLFGQFLQYFSLWAAIGVLYIISLFLIAGIAFMQRQNLQDVRDNAALLPSEEVGRS